MPIHHDSRRRVGPLAMNLGGKVMMGYKRPIPMQQGGSVPGHSPVPPMMREGEQHDTVPALLTPGEFVLDSDSTQLLDILMPGFLDMANSCLLYTSPSPRDS